MEKRKQQRKALLSVADVIKDFFSRRDHIELLTGKLLQIFLIIGFAKGGLQCVILPLLCFNLRRKRLLLRLRIVNLFLQIQ